MFCAALRWTICRPMARRCCLRIGVPLPISSPAGPSNSAGTSGAATAVAPRSSPTIRARTGAVPDAITIRPERWIAARKAELLACPYFHVTVTVPAELRHVLRANQRDGYAALMRAAADGIIELARDPHHVGGTVGVMAVLHTWTQQLVYHPHVHCLVTGGGTSDDGRD